MAGLFGQMRYQQHFGKYAGLNRYGSILATAAPIPVNAFELCEFGDKVVIGVREAVAFLIVVSIGTLPRTSVEWRRAMSPATPSPNTSIALPQCGHTVSHMFSTIPSTGFFSSRSMVSPRSATADARLSGVVTTIPPSSGMSRMIVSWASEVPGERFIYKY